MIEELNDTTGPEVTVSRDTWPHALLFNYETVVTREGKPAIDAEVNELNDVNLYERLELSRDVFYDGFIKGDVFGDNVNRESFEVTWDGTNVNVKAGRGRLVQRRCDLLTDLNSGVSGNALSGFAPPASGAANYKYIYVDVFRREYNSDPDLPYIDATDSTPGNDPFNSDPSLGGEQARRIQWFNRNTDVKATAQNIAIPSPATGHSIFPLAKIERIGVGFTTIRVTDLRRFGGVKASHTVAEFVVRSGGTPQVDCTHTDFMDAWADALLLSTSIKVSIWVVSGTFNITAGLTMRENIAIIGRTERTNNALSVPVLRVSSVGPAVILPANTSIINMHIRNLGTGSAIFATGNQWYLRNVKTSTALVTASGLEVNNGCAGSRIKECDLGNVFVTAQNSDVVFSDCKITGGELGNTAVTWINCRFNVISGTAIKYGTNFYGCVFTGSFFWNTVPSVPTNLFSCDAGACDMTLTDADAHVFTAYGSKFQYIRHTGVDNMRTTVLIGCEIFQIFADGTSAVPAVFDIRSTRFTSTISGVACSVRIQDSVVEAIELSDGELIGKNSTTLGLTVSGDGSAECTNCKLTTISIAGDGDLTFDNCQLTDVSFGALGSGGTCTWSNCRMGLYNQGGVSDTGTNYFYNCIVGDVTLGSCSFDAVGSTFGNVSSEESANINATNCFFGSISFDATEGGGGTYNWTRCSFVNYEMNASSTRGSHNFYDVTVVGLDLTSSDSTVAHNVYVQGTFVLPHTGVLKYVSVAGTTETANDPTQSIDLVMDGCSFSGGLEVSRLGPDVLTFKVQINNTTADTMTIEADGQYPFNVALKHVTVANDLTINMRTEQIYTSNVDAIMLAHVEVGGDFVYTVNGFFHTKILNSTFNSASVISVDEQGTAHYVYFESCSFGARQLYSTPTAPPTIGFQAKGESTGSDSLFLTCRNCTFGFGSTYPVYLGSATPGEQKITSVFENCSFSETGGVSVYMDNATYGFARFSGNTFRGNIHTDQDITVTLCYFTGVTPQLTGTGVIDAVNGSAGPAANNNTY